MADNGGYRKPSTPAAVSGPGKFSQRTDGQPGATPKQAQRYVGGGEWGTNKAFNSEVVNQAPMAADSSMSGETQLAPASAQPDLSSINHLLSPTQKPEEPVTTGASMGEGAGPEAMQYTRDLNQQQDVDLKALQQLLPVLRQAADKAGSSYATRLLLKKINATIGMGNV